MEIPSYFFFSVLAGVIGLILLEVFRPEVLGLKKAVRTNLKLDTNHGVSPPT